MKNVRKTISFLAVAACVSVVGAGVALTNHVTASAEVAVADGITLTNGASIRIDAPTGEEQLGAIRFKANVDTSKIDLETSEFGIIVAKYTDGLTEENFVFNTDGTDLVAENAWQQVSNQDDGFNYDVENNAFSFVSTGIPMSDYNTRLAARAYVKTGTDYAYTPFTEYNVRSVFDIAQACIKDTTSEGNINDDTSDIYKYRDQVLNMMGNTLISGTIEEGLTGNLQLVSEEETIHIGEVSGTYSFACNEGEYTLRLVRDEAIDYEYSLSVGASNVTKDLAKLPFYMYTAPNKGGTAYDVAEQLGWYNNSGDAKTAYLAVKEDGNLKIDGSEIVEGNFTNPRLQVKLTDPQFWDNYFYQVIYDHTFTNIPGSTGTYTLAVGTQNYYISWKEQGNVIQAMPYLAQETGRTAMEGKVKAVFAYDGDPVGFGEGKSVPSNILNLLWLKSDSLSANGLQAEISPFTLRRLTPRSDEFTYSGHTISMTDYFGLSGDVSQTWVDSLWTDGKTMYNGNIGHVACGQTSSEYDPTVMGVNAYQFLKWESSDENYIKVVVKEGHSLEHCKNNSCWGHYQVVRGSTATDKKVTLTGILQIDDGPEYPVVRRIFNPTATTDTTTATAAEFKASHWQTSAHVTNGTVDFAVKSASTEPRILQITDTQIVDGSQAENTGNSAVVPSHYSKQTLSKVDQFSFDAVGYAIQSSNPDLIIVTGDMIYGQFDHTGAAWTKFVDYMESFNIPWAPIFGNHEAESNMGIAWQCAQLDAAKHCLFKRGEVTGNGNYTVGIVNSADELVRVFYMMDTNGNYNASETSVTDGQIKKSNGFADDQFEWFKTSVANVKEKAPNAKLSLAIHIPLMKFNDALTTPYGYANESEQETFKLDIDSFEGKNEGDFGYINTTYHNYYWDDDDTLWTLLKDNGFDSVFTGHIHENSASVVYDGIRLHFGLKSGIYDSTLWKKSDGTLVKSNTDQGDPIIGGSYFVLGTDGAITDAEHLYYHGVDGVYLEKV